MKGLSCLSLSDFSKAPIPPHTAIALGNFDGVHIAHRSLLKKAVQIGRETHLAPCVFIFEPEPAFLLFPEKSGENLCTFQQKLQKFADCGCLYAIVADFSEFSDCSPESFVQDVLIKTCNCEIAVCGFNYHFGKGGSADADTLKALMGGNVCIIDQIQKDGIPVSSTNIRKLLQDGKIEAANSLLGCEYSIESEVRHGKSLGHTLGFPTANQDFPPRQLVPKCGVYASKADIDGITYYGISNIGSHPTVDKEAKINCETYFLDFSGDLYGKIIETKLTKFLRPEKKFDSLDELKKQIQADVGALK